MDLAEARWRAEARLRIELDSTIDVAALKGALEPYRIGQRAPHAAANGGAAGAAGSGCRVVVAYRNRDGLADLALPEAWRVRPDENLLLDLKARANVRGAYFNYG
jgi:hypothetical protein